MIISELDSFLGFIVNLPRAATGEVGHQVAYLGEVVETLAFPKLLQKFIDNDRADLVAAFSLIFVGFIRSIQGGFIGKMALQFVFDAIKAFVIGGGVSKAGEVLFDYIEKNYKKYVFHGAKDAKFCLATLGNDAGIYGAAKLIIG